MLVKSAWLMECFWSLERRDETPFLMHKVTPGVIRSNNINSNTNSTNSSRPHESTHVDDSDDDDFAAEFESELMDMN